MTDTLKRQPWRLLWPSTKKYEIAATGVDAPASPSPLPTASKHARRLTVRGKNGDGSTAVTATARTIPADDASH